MLNSITLIGSGSAVRPALPPGRSSASHDPSVRVSTWRGFMFVLARHNRSAPVSAALRHKG